MTEVRRVEDTARILVVVGEEGMPIMMEKRAPAPRKGMSSRHYNAVVVVCAHTGEVLFELGVSRAHPYKEVIRREVAQNSEHSPSSTAKTRKVLWTVPKRNSTPLSEVWWKNFWPFLVDIIESHVKEVVSGWSSGDTRTVYISKMLVVGGSVTECPKRLEVPKGVRFTLASVDAVLVGWVWETYWAKNMPWAISGFFAFSLLAQHISVPEAEELWENSQAFRGLTDQLQDQQVWYIACSLAVTPKTLIAEAKKRSRTRAALWGVGCEKLRARFLEQMHGFSVANAEDQALLDIFRHSRRVVFRLLQHTDPGKFLRVAQLVAFLQKRAPHDHMPQIGHVRIVRVDTERLTFELALLPREPVVPTKPKPKKTRT